MVRFIAFISIQNTKFAFLLNFTSFVEIKGPNPYRLFNISMWVLSE